MNCELELIDKYLKREYPYIVKVKEIVELPQSIGFSGATFNLKPDYLISIYIKQSFYDQLENNGPLKSITIKSFSTECAQTIKSICTDMQIFTTDNETNLSVLFIRDTEI